MKLSKFCDETLVVFNLKATEKQAVIDELVELCLNDARPAM
jgi:hypothetical protein